MLFYSVDLQELFRNFLTFIRITYLYFLTLTTPAYQYEQLLLIAAEMSIFGKLFKRRTNPPPADSPAVGDDGMQISKPTNVKHEWHVGFDQSTGQINGLPPVWEAWLKNSDIRQVFYFFI